ncbi:g13418 [Coccomyxa viridis]|uniref:alpha-amylase n=1 Tax=Coccomyxa viridis TaxID=1274662 RepID=A0ABP1GCQ6_9CHLO
MPAAKDSRENQRAQLLLQEYTARLQSQLQAVEADLADLCRAAWAAGPGPGTPMSQVLDRQEEDVIVPELDLASAPLPPTEHVVDEGAAPEGTGYEIMLQAFNWESHNQNWYQRVTEQANRFASLGFTCVWLPPFTESVSPQGYMPLDLYNLNSRYGSEEDLRRCVAKLQSCGLKVLGDCVLNHRCASQQDSKGVWNQYGGRLDWDARAIVRDDHNFGGRGGPASGDCFSAAPNIDHAQPFVKRDLCEWMSWLRSHVGFDGWRLDFVRGFHGSHVRDYVRATEPSFVVGEFWDSLAYNGGLPDHNQDAHRQRIVNWINDARGNATAFDVTTKGILHAVFERGEFWRLRDAVGKPPGLMGWWPSRAVTFLENHDTGSTQGHWRFPSNGVEQGYVYLMTHPGTPSLFYDHLEDPQLATTIQRLISLRLRAGIHCRSKVTILRAEADIYLATVDDSLLMKIGPRSHQPDASWTPAESGQSWGTWLRR